MATLISRVDCLEAWRAVATALLPSPHEEYNVVVSIEQPTAQDPLWLVRFNPAAVHADGDNVRDVANTLFPTKSLKNAADRASFYERYKRAHSKSRRKRWGTYFLRMIDFGGKQVNQLENIIAALTKWKNKPHAALTFHISSPETDALRPLGAPCLHFGEFTCSDGQTLDLVVVYRNHDYFNKAFGNFIGLGRLLEFMASETGMSVGTLTCHSVRAYFDCSQQTMKQLLAR